MDVAFTHCEMAGGYWLNGFDMDNSGTSMVIDSQNLTRYTNWNTFEPNDFFGINEKCIDSNTGNGGRWYDFACSSTKSDVCERDL